MGQPSLVSQLVLLKGTTRQGALIASLRLLKGTDRHTILAVPLVLDCVGVKRQELAEALYECRYFSCYTSHNRAAPAPGSRAAVVG